MQAKFLLIFHLCFFFCFNILGQPPIQLDSLVKKDTAKIVEHSLSIEGYIDAYASIYSDKRPSNSFEQFQTISPRSNHFGLNIIQLAITYKHSWVRCKMAFHYGDMVLSSWDPVFNVIQEANLGIHLSKGFWLEGGLFKSHIGTEYFMPKENSLSSLTLLTFNEPYYQSGFRLSYEGSERFSAAVWLVSGYNFFLDKNKDKSFGANASFKISDAVEIGYSGLFGNEQPDSATQEQFRAYQNIWVEGKWRKVTLLMGADFGLQTNSKLNDNTQLAWMLGALAILSIQWNKWFSTSFRGEVFYDPDGFIGGCYSNTNNNSQGLQMVGATLGLAFQPTSFSYIRLEGRWLHDFNNLLLFAEDAPKSYRWEGMLTIGAYFAKEFNLAKKKQKNTTSTLPVENSLLR